MSTRNTGSGRDPDSRLGEVAGLGKVAGLGNVSRLGKVARLGEFEFLLLLAVLRQADAPYANRVREDLEENSGRNVTRGALYRTIDRLVDKGLLAWELEPSEVPERGGHPMRRLNVTEDGLAAVRQSRSVLFTFLDGLDPILGEP